MRSLVRRLVDGERLAEVGPVIARVTAIGLIVVAAVVIAVFATRPRGDYEVEAVFDSTRGLIEGGEVTAGFQQVGSVKEITLDDEDGLPHVAMEISDEDFVLHQGASANIRLTSNVGAVNRVVDLTEGDPEAPELESGAVLGPSTTDEPVDLDAATSTLDPRTRKDAGALLAGLEAATRHRGPDLNRLLQHSSPALNETANALEQVSADGAALRSLVQNGRIVVSALARDRKALGTAAERTATLLEIAGARQQELARTTNAIGPALASGEEILANLDAAVPDLRALVRGTRPLVDRLAPSAGDLADTIKASGPVLEESRKLVRQSPGYAKRTVPVVEASIPLLRDFDPTLAHLNPFMDHLRVRIPEAAGFFTLAGDAQANYDVNGHMIRFVPRFIQLPRNTNLIGPSENVPGSLVPPFDRTPGVLEGDPWIDYADSFIGGGQAVGSYRAAPVMRAPWDLSPEWRGPAP